MARLVVIEGKVVGGHRLEDLGVTVPHNGEVSLDADRAEWSRDLNEALRLGHVVRKRVISNRRPTPRATSRRRTKPKPASKPKRSKPQKRAPEPETVQESEPAIEIEDTVGMGLLETSVANAVDQMTEENRKLREMNEALMKQQEALLAQLGSFLERSQSAPQVQYVPSGEHAASASSSDEEDDLPTYIPAKIRSGGMKVSGQDLVKEDVKENSAGLDEAADLLAQLRKASDD